VKARKPYADEFKQEAVKLVIEQGMTTSQVARDLDISVDTLHRWLRAARPPTDAATDAPTPPTELVRLRRENEQLRLERDILKKALGIFSRMPQ
jgi:transposase